MYICCLYQQPPQRLTQGSQYYKVGKPVILPGVGVRSDVILPKSSMRWLLAQPDDVLSGAAATVDFTYIYYALGTDAPLLDPWQGMVGVLIPGAFLAQQCTAISLAALVRTLHSLESPNVETS